ncbi:MAG: trypsin-like peptidase domain-containing protein [Phycisphaerales bacterium]
MPRFASLAPAAVVAASCVLVLWATPRIAQRTVDERAALQAEQSRQVLGRRNVLAEISEAQRELAQVVEPSVVFVESVLDGRGGQRSGSGWVFDAEGHVVTNAHVVAGAGRVTGQTSTGAVLEAEVVGLDLRTDIAVLLAAGEGLVAAERSQRTPLQGELVFAFGSPFDFRFSMSAGIVSGIGRTAGLSSIDYENFIQVDAAINPGNSGGPLCDVYGRVIGMNTAIATGRGATLGQGQFGGIGLAIPMEIIESIVGQVLERGIVEQGYLGVVTTPLRDLQARGARADPGTEVPAPLKAAIEQCERDGLVVSHVAVGEAAERAGLDVGDVILEFNGRPVSTTESLTSLIATQRPGASARLVLWEPPGQDGVPMVREVAVVIGRRPAEADAEALLAALRRAGVLDLTNATEDACAALGVPHRRGVLVEAIEQGSAAESALPEGSVIIAVEGQAVFGESDLYARLDRILSRAFPGSFRRVQFSVVLPDGRPQGVVIPVQAPRR